MLDHVVSFLNILQEEGEREVLGSGFENEKKGLQSPLPPLRLPLPL